MLYMRARTFSFARGCIVGLLVLLGATSASAQSARTRYESALSREPEVRRLIDSTRANAASAARASVDRRVKQVVTAYDAIVRRYPTSGYSDNALAQAGGLYEALFERFGREDDRATALRYYRQMVSAYPHSSLVKKTRATISTLSNARAARAEAPAKPAAERPATRASRVVVAPPAEPDEPETSDPVPALLSSPVPAYPEPLPMPVPARTSAAIPTLPRAMLTEVQRTVLPEAVRVTLTFDREVAYHEERIAGPARVFFDLLNVTASTPLVDAVLDYEQDVVRQIRLGRHPDKTVRVVLDLEGVTKHSVFTLYNPYRIVIDCERPSAVRAAAVVPTMPAPPPLPPPPAPVVRAAVSDEAPLNLAKETELPAASPPTDEPALAAPLPAREAVSAPTAPPAPPSANSAGGFSIARQLGLGVSRIVIDPGHGGRDPGVQGRGMSEAPLTLDVALRLEKLLLKETGVEVVLTRRSDVYVPLEERTEIANREGADLFLSIHANASRNTEAGGIETYYLSFASSPEAEAVAARENSASGRSMHNLPDIVKAIALNNKLDESRDFASMVQESMVSRARRSNKAIRDRGVKKAPFVVLIGANMPSILAEVSFLSNRQENQLLRSAAYKDRIAEALHAAVMRYRRALKGQSKVAEQ